MTLKTTIMIADQLIARLQFLHSKSFIYTNVKPANFLIGLGKKSNIVYLTGLSNAKLFRDLKTHQHIPYIQ